jgi:hypothetical protein
MPSKCEHGLILSTVRAVGYRGCRWSSAGYQLAVEPWRELRVAAAVTGQNLELVMRALKGAKLRQGVCAAARQSRHREWRVTIRGRAFIAGAFEHPGQRISGKSTAQVHAKVAFGALADAGSPLPSGDRAGGGKPPMPADLTSANSDDLSKLCLPMAASAQANGACGRAVRTFPWSSTSLSPTRAIRH